MLTTEHVEHFGGPLSIALGTASRDGKPGFVRCWAMQGEPGGTQLTVYAPVHLASHALADLGDNPRLAITASDMSNFRTFQYKGRYVAHTDKISSEAEAYINHCHKTVSTDLIAQFFGPEAAQAWAAYVSTPAVEVTMQIEQIFDQTPGPSAGKRTV